MTARPGDALVLPRGPNPLARTLNRLTSPGSGPKASLTFHRWLYLRSGGRLGHGLIGAPTLVLYTTGRRSGQPRTSIVAYVHDAGRLIVAGTNGGAGGNPAWFLNVCANPHVDVQVGRRRWSVVATVIDDAHPEYARLAQRLNEVTHGRIASYQAAAPRTIPLVIFTRVDRSSAR